jgi:hypothetical protein
VLCKSFDNQDNQVIFHGSAQPSQSRDIAEPLESPWQDPSFYSDYPTEIATKYRYLFLSYSCKKAQSLYIEKFFKDKRIHIFITPDISQEDMSKRISVMAECPSTSDSECIGEVVNSFVSVNPEGYCFYDDNENKCVLKKDVTRCEVDKKVGKDCLCGDKYASAVDHGGIDYCLKKGDAYALMPFLCSQITSCADYCKISDTAATECIGDERTYCDEDFCTKGCQVDGSGKNVVCKNKA